MARTTDDKKDSTVILRINDDTRGYLENESQKAGVTMSKYIRGVIEKSKSGNIGLREERFDSLNNIEGMVRAAGGTLDGFLKDLAIKLEWGVLELEDGVIKVE